jgi:hypothetical protein
VGSDRWPLTSLPDARRAANGEPQTRHRSPIGSPSVLYRRVLQVRHLRCRIGSLLLAVRSRQVRVAPIARTDRVWLGPGTARRLCVQASLGLNRRGNPPRPAITSQLAAPTRRPILLRPRHRLHAFPSLCWNHAQRKRAKTRRAFNRIGTRPTGPMGNARRATPAPQSKPVTHASRLVTHNTPSVAFKLGNPGRRASSPTTVLPFAALADPDRKKSARTPPHESADPPPPATGPGSHRP